MGNFVTQQSRCTTVLLCYNSVVNIPTPERSGGIRNVVGVPVQGSDFFDREDERRTIWRRLETDHVLLPSPRRVGKTSLMRALAAEATDHGFAGATYVDVAGAADEREFVVKLGQAIARSPGATAIEKKLRRGPLARWLSRITSVTAGAIGVGLREERSKTWKELGEELCAALLQQNSRWLILCDELGIFAQTLLRRERGDATRARAFLTWLRDDVRQANTDPDAGGDMRWIVASSVGLPTLTDLNNIGDTINDFQLVPVGAFAPEVADLFLARLAQGRKIELEPAVRQRIVTKVGWPIPYYLQVFFATLTESRKVVTIADVDATFEKLLGLEYRTYFDWWSQRLVEELGRSRAHQARTLLTACAAKPEGVRADTLTALVGERITDPSEREWAEQRMFDVLESDGYWIRDGERYRFRSNLLREYWLRRHRR